VHDITTSVTLAGGTYRHHRVVRGGSWINNQRNARCAYRNRNQPDNFNNNIGFRLVLSIAGFDGR